MNDADEYTSNRHLRKLTTELELLNRCLIEAGLPDQVRIDCMRRYGETSLRYLEYLKEFVFEPKLPAGITEVDGGRFRARINTHGARLDLGTFDTVEQASEAYRKAHVAKFGEQSRYYQQETALVE